VGGCGAGRRCLGGVQLRLAQLRDRGGQGDELSYQGNGHECGVACQVPGEYDHLGGAAQLVAVVATGRDPPVGGAGSAVIGVGSAL
jgi:hypothetical protein